MRELRNKDTFVAVPSGGKHSGDYGSCTMPYPSKGLTLWTCNMISQQDSLGGDDQGKIRGVTGVPKQATVAVLLRRISRKLAKEDIYHGSGVDLVDLCCLGQ